MFSLLRIDFRFNWKMTSFIMFITKLIESVLKRNDEARGRKPKPHSLCKGLYQEETTTRKAKVKKILFSGNASVRCARLTLFLFPVKEMQCARIQMNVITFLTTFLNT